jgi:pimeloyl-ACP methyl ester carboxylesterase
VWGTAKSLWNFDRLELDQAGEQGLRPCGLVEQIQVFGPLYSIKAYDPLLRSLQQMGYSVGRDLLIFDYDWRQSNYDTADLLAKFVESNRQAGRIGASFDIIAHSMGGVVTRIYLQSDPARLVHKVIYLATPFLGSGNTFGTLSEGWGTIENAMAGGKEKIRQVALSFPGFLELLPRFEECCYVRTPGAQPRYINVFLADEWQALGWLPPQIANDPQRLAAFRQTLERAQSLSALLQSPSPGVIEVKFAGDAHPTRSYMGMLSTATMPGPNNWIFTKGLGDGTVPAWSAARKPKFDNLEGSLVSFAEHATIFDDKWVVSEIARELLAIGEINRRPIAGSGHPVISVVVDGVERNWTIASLEITVTEPYLRSGEKIAGVAIVQLDGTAPDLNVGSISPKLFVRRADTSFELPLSEQTSPADIANSRVVYKFETSTVGFVEGASELTLTIPNASQAASAFARVVIIKP